MGRSTGSDSRPSTRVSPNPYGRARIRDGVDPRERELLTGMGNCFEACGSDFAGTVEMVAHARHRTVEDVRETLAAMAHRDGQDPEYQALRRRLPASFPF